MILNRIFKRLSKCKLWFSCATGFAIYDCGQEIELEDTKIAYKFNFCPFCGRKL